MTGRADVRRQLASVPLFFGLSRAEIDTILQVADRRTVSQGEILCQEGDAGKEFFLIAAGDAVVTQRGRQLRRLGPGDFFGELALLDRGPRSATVTADGPMTVHVIKELDFTALLDEVPAVAHKLLATLASRLRESETRTAG